jgi:hypothetical protein
MNEFLLGLIIVVIIANLAYTIWSYFSLKKLSNRNQVVTLEDKFLLEHIVHTRSSLNVIYTSIVTVSFLLAFFGFNLKDKLTQEVTKEISASAKVDLDMLRTKANEISILDSLSTSKSADIVRIAEKARLTLDGITKNMQRLYVIQGLPLPVNPQKHFYKYSELRPVDGSIIQAFSKPPVIFCRGYDNEAEIPMRVKATTDGIEVGQTVIPFNVDLFIYPTQ